MEDPKRDIHVPMKKGESQVLLSKLGAWERGEGAITMRTGEEEGFQGHDRAENMSQRKNT